MLLGMAAGAALGAVGVMAATQNHHATVYHNFLHKKSV